MRQPIAVTPLQRAQLDLRENHVGCLAEAWIRQVNEIQFPAWLRNQNRRKISSEANRAGAYGLCVVAKNTPSTSDSPTAEFESLLRELRNGVTSCSRRLAKGNGTPGQEPRHAIIRQESLVSARTFMVAGSLVGRKTDARDSNRSKRDARQSRTARRWSKTARAVRSIDARVKSQQSFMVSETLDVVLLPLERFQFGRSVSAPIWVRYSSGVARYCPCDSH